MPLQNRGWVAAIALSLLMLSSSFNMIPLASYQQQDTQYTVSTNTTSPTTSTIAQPPQAALTGVVVEPTNNLVLLGSHYVIGFTTATTGIIKTITITFPSGFGVGTTKLIEASGISPGTISISGQDVTYTVTSPISVPVGTKIMIMLGKIVNGATISNSLSVTTKDVSNVVIDGPSASAFTLKTVASNMIAGGAVTAAKIGTGAVTAPKMAVGSVNSTSIADGSITKADVSAGFSLVTTNQQCLGKIVTGFDASGNLVCKFIIYYPDKINTVDSTGSVGTFTSIAIGTDGFPVIIYYDNVSGGLKLVHCTSASCGAHDTPTTLDSTGIRISSASFTSIAYGTDGFPVISYSDNTNGDLKAVQR